MFVFVVVVVVVIAVVTVTVDVVVVVIVVVLSLFVVGVVVHSVKLATSFRVTRSEEHTSELQSRLHLVCRLLLEKKKDFS